MPRHNWWDGGHQYLIQELQEQTWQWYLGLWRHSFQPSPDTHSCSQLLCDFDIQKTSHGIHLGSLNHGRRVLASPSHYEDSDEFITSGPTNGFERQVLDSRRSLWVLHSHASDVAWPRQGLTALPDERAAVNKLCVISWSMRVESKMSVLSFPPVWCSVSVGTRCVPLFPLVCSGRPIAG